jgi:hypothetical protein
MHILQIYLSNMVWEVQNIYDYQVFENAKYWRLAAYVHVLTFPVICKDIPFPLLIFSCIKIW